MEEILVPIALFAIIPVIVWSVSHYRHKTQKAHSEVLTAMANKGEAITPEIIASLGVKKNAKGHDLRRGLILIAAAIATYLFSQFLPEDEAKTVFAGFAMFPLFIGVAYTGLWFLISRKDD